MRKKTKIYLFIFFLLNFTFNIYSIEKNESAKACKIRLPNEINSYQPVLVPVLSPDGNRLYFDRKWHPSNNNGIKDPDDIWYSDKLNDSVWNEPKNLYELNTPEPDVLFWISPDGRKGLVNGIYKEDNKNKGHGFSFCEFDGRKWDKPEQLKILNFYNDSLNFYAHLSANGDILIMSLSRKDAVGGLDLYVSFLNMQTQNWSEPVNLGRDINTTLNEEAPYLAYDNKTLYFSSNGYNGEGGQDLFVSRRLDDSWTRWSKPQNLGKIINTKKSENGIWLTAAGDSAIIVSNDTLSERYGLYWVCLPEDIQPEPYTILSGIIDLEKNNENIQVVNISIGDKPEQKINIAILKNYDVVLSDKKKYNLRISAQGYEDIYFDLDTRNIRKSQNVRHDFILHQKDNISDKVIIYFDTDSYELKADSKKTLNIISQRKNVTQIKITGHADETGTDEYNMKLSMRRAKVTKDYLIKAGLRKSNILIFAKGKNEPVSTDLGKNRRSEITIK